MHIKQVMSSKPDFLAPSTTLKQAANEMLKRDIGFIPIGENDRLIGVITDRDIAIRAIAKGIDPNKTTLKDVMTKKVLYCFEDEDIKDASKKMAEQHIRRLIVLNRDKRMTGIVSLGDIAAKTKDETLTGHILHEVCEDLH